MGVWLAVVHSFVVLVLTMAPAFAQPYGPDTCRDGYVWRDACPGDHVCVTPEAGDLTAADNREAAARRAPGGGPYGPDTCLPGYVWREACPGDHVCVTPPMREQVRLDDSQRSTRLKTEFCQLYVETAIIQNRRANERECGFGGPRWSYDRSAHYRWCVNVSDAQADQEGRARADMLAQCGAGGREAFCRGYANQAVAQNNQNLALACRYTGPRWQSASAPHHNWCMSLRDRSTAQAETSARTRELESCRYWANQRPPQGVARINFFNCSAERRAYYYWILNSNGNADRYGPFAHNYSGAGTCPGGGGPFEVSLGPGVSYQITAVDPQQANCDAGDPADGDCIKQAFAFLGDVNGPTLTIRVPGP